MTKLHLGCGSNIKPGWVNVDLIPGPGVDWVCDIRGQQSALGLCDEILAEHLLEHLNFYDAQVALANWHRALKPGGKLTLECPDLGLICRSFAEGNLYEQYESFEGGWGLIQQIYGHQRGRDEPTRVGQTHKSGYTPERLTFMLNGIGFTNVTRLEPVKPGLNFRIEATKP